MENKKLLLLSNSTNPGEEYLFWPRKYIMEFLLRHRVEKILFLPYAGMNLSSLSLEESYKMYCDKLSKYFLEFGVTLQSIHNSKNPIDSVEHAQAIVVGGGNTFHLVKMMHELGIMEAIRNKVNLGIPYIGWSAGANVACPTLKTTNDMPIIEPSSFGCLNIIPFQINPHYQDVNPPGFGGETREQRILEFLAVNRNIAVVGLRESTLLEINGKSILFKGIKNMRYFKYGINPVEIEPGGNVDFLQL
jgi:dipeptidase E